MGGPEAPALRRVEADGDGGGKTTPVEWWESDRLRWPARGVDVDAAVIPVGPPAPPVPPPPEVWPVAAGDVSSAVPDSPSEASEGICTFKRGRDAADFADEFVLVRDGGMMPSEDIALDRLLCVAARDFGVCWRARDFGPGEPSSLLSGRGGSGDLPKKCEARTEPLASMGV